MAGIGAPYELIIPDGQLRFGNANRIFVAAVTPNGDVPSRAPRVTASVGAVAFDEILAAGVFSYTFELPPDASVVEFSIGVFGVRYTKRLDVYVDPPSHLVLPKRIDGVVRGGEISFVVTGEDLPPPEALQIVLSEGRVAGIDWEGQDLKVRILPDDSPFPRYIVIGIRDTTRVERPVWTGLRLRARPRLDYTLEPGALATFIVGERTYGPYEADDKGKISGWVDQYPGENVALGTFVDDLGNETRTDIPLATQTSASLVAFPTGEFVIGRPPPMVYLHAVRGDGGLWNRAAPKCRTPALDLSTRQLQSGNWIIPLPELDPNNPQDLRIECSIGIHASVALRVRVAEGIPNRIRLRVWPTELRTDFPEAEISVIIEDARGDRIDVTGLQVRAARGDVAMDALSGAGASGEYMGGNAAEAGLDTVQATYIAPPSDGFADSVRLAWEDVPKAGRVTLHARVRDATLRPVVGAIVGLDAGGAVETAVSGPDGWVTADVVLPMKNGPVTLRASAAGRVDQALVLKGQNASDYGPGTPDLRADQVIKISPGRISGISMYFDPPQLRASPGATAFVYVRLEDRAGKAVVDEPVSLTASEGVVTPLRPMSNGYFQATYSPGPVETSRKVEIIAETETLHSSAKLELLPRLVRVSIDATGGVLTNFGAVTAPFVGADVDIRVRTELLGEQMMIRIGGARYAFGHVYRLRDGEKWVIDTTVYPVTLAALYRFDRGPTGAWLGGGAVVGTYTIEARTGGNIVYDSLAVTGGPAVMGGIGKRVFGGELFITSRAIWLRGGGEDLGFTGNIGGLAIGAGYRVLF